MIKIYCDSSTLEKQYKNIDFSKLLLVEAFNNRNIDFINVRTNTESVKYKSVMIYLVNSNMSIEDIVKDLKRILIHYRNFNTIFIATSLSKDLLDSVRIFIKDNNTGANIKLYNSIGFDTTFARILIRSVIIASYNIFRKKTKK